MTVGEVYDILEKWAPVSSAMPGDNPGFLVGNKNDAVTKILVIILPFLCIKIILSLKIHLSLYHIR